MASRTIAPAFVVSLIIALILPFSICGLSFPPTTPKSLLVDIRLAKIPQDLPAIRECRSSDPAIVASALPKFLQAESLSSGLSVGIIAKERLYPFRVLGCTDVRFSEKSGRALVQNVYVRNEARGLGLGKRMMEYVERVARSKPEMERLELCVDTSNFVAISLYEKCGFHTPHIHSVVNKIGKTSGASLQISMAKSLS